MTLVRNSLSNDQLLDKYGKLVPTNTVRISDCDKSAEEILDAQSQYLESENKDMTPQNLN